MQAGPRRQGALWIPCHGRRKGRGGEGRAQSSSNQTPGLRAVWPQSVARERTPCPCAAASPSLPGSPWSQTTAPISPSSSSRCSGFQVAAAIVLIASFSNCLLFVLRATLCCYWVSTPVAGSAGCGHLGQPCDLALLGCVRGWGGAPPSQTLTLATCRTQGRKPAPGTPGSGSLFHFLQVSGYFHTEGGCLPPLRPAPPSMLLFP